MNYYDKDVLQLIYKYKNQLEQFELKKKLHNDLFKYLKNKKIKYEYTSIRQSNFLNVFKNNIFIGCHQYSHQFFYFNYLFNH